MNHPLPIIVMQAIFDKVVGQLLQQGKGSMSDDKVCKYRGPDGTKCAVGFLLTDQQIEKYDVREGNLPNEFKADLVREICPIENVREAQDFLRDLQRAHDNATLPSERGGTWADRLKEGMNGVATTWKLIPIAESR